jgi:DNA-binding NarL/FixJ family response regulator
MRRRYSPYGAGSGVTITILIADDHAVVAEALQSLVDAQPDMKVVGLAGNGREAVRQTLEKKPDVVVMDNAMPELNGTEAARIIGKSCPGTRVVMLSMHSSSAHIEHALQAGAGGYVLKVSVGRELVDAIRAVHAGRRYISTPLADESLKRLSRREREVLELVVAGATSKEIAVRLGISAPSVDTYRSRLMAKLTIEDVPGLVRFAIRHGIASV